MSEKTRVRKTYTGRAEQPISWDALIEMAIVLWGPEVVHLPSYPKVIGGVFAHWTDATGVSHALDTLDELRQPYESFKTYEITISGRLEGKYADLEYRPAKAEITVAVERSTHEDVDSILLEVKKVFPIKDRYVFISYDTQDLKIADFIKACLSPRLPTGTSVFIAKRDIAAGENPLKRMLEHELPKAEVLVAICSPASRNSPWLWWESAAVWSRGRPVVPLFMGCKADEFGGPLALVTQGKDLFDSNELESALTVVCSVFADSENVYLSEEEKNKLELLGSETMSR